MNQLPLFCASCMAFVDSALIFATRAGVIVPWIIEFDLNVTEIGWIV